MARSLWLDLDISFQACEAQNLDVTLRMSWLYFYLFIREQNSKLPSTGALASFLQWNDECQRKS
jgi:hypothetical protein